MRMEDFTRGSGLRFKRLKAWLCTWHWLAAIGAMVTAGLCSAAEGDLRPKVGRGMALVNAKGNGPWGTRVMLAISSNGLVFSRLHFVLSDQAGAPNVVIDHHGLARVYYNDFGNSNVLACAVQQNKSSLTNWSHHQVRIHGLPKGTSEPADPAVVLVTSNQYRLYFMQGRPRPAIYSAVATNGIDFTAEPGTRFVGGGSGMPDSVYDPCVLRTGNEWWLWCGPDGRFSARSGNGLVFSDTGEFKIEGVSFMPWSAVVLPGKKGYRLYGNFRGPGEWGGGVASVSSADGVNWKRDDGIRLSLGRSKYSLEEAVMPDNGCAVWPNGRWLMAYVAVIPRRR